MAKAPKIDDKKFAAHMARNQKPNKISSTKKSLADIRKKAEDIEEVLDTPKAMQSYKNKAKASYDKAASSAAAKILRGKDKDGKRADHRPELRTMAKRKKGMTAADMVAVRRTFKNLRNEEVEHISEKLSVSDGMGAWIDDFKKSDAPQFKGKSDKERRDMAIAAYLSAKRGDKNESFDFRVNVDGFPEMFMSGNSPGEVKANLRQLVKQPSMIKSVDRVTKHDKKKQLRKLAMGEEKRAGEVDYGSDESVKMMKKKTPGQKEEGFMDMVKKGASYIMKNNNGKSSVNTNRNSTSGKQNSKPSPSGGSIAQKINFGGRYSK